MFASCVKGLVKALKPLAVGGVDWMMVRPPALVAKLEAHRRRTAMVMLPR